MEEKKTGGKKGLIIFGVVYSIFPRTRWPRGLFLQNFKFPQLIGEPQFMTEKRVQKGGVKKGVNYF